MIKPPLEELLRETLDRLGRQEQRTAAIEAALLEAQPTILASPVASRTLAQTPAARTAETPVAARSKRDCADERSARPPKVDPPFASSAISSAAVVASLDEVVWSISPDGQLVFFAGGAVERFYGLTEHELQDGPGRWLDAVPAEDRERLRAALARLPDVDTFTLEHRILHPVGFRWAVTRGKLVRDRDGRPLRVDGLTADITRHARTRSAVLDVLTGLGSTTGNEFLLRLMQQLCAVFGVWAAVIVEPHPGEPHSTRTVAAWIGGQQAEPFVFPATSGLIRELLSGGRAFVPASARERYPADSWLRQLRAEALTAEPLIDERGRVLGCVAVVDDRTFNPDSELRAVLKSLAPRAAVELARDQDDSGERELATQLAEAERRACEAESVVRGAANLAAAGRMAAGLAHDFNNLLGVIAGNADLIRESLPPDDSRRESAELIAQTAQSVAMMNRKLLAVGKPSSAHVAPLDAARAIRTLEPILRRLIGKRISLGFDLASGLPFLSADAAQFDRVILNLALNARDAIEAGSGSSGTITIRAARVTVESNSHDWPADRPPGEYVAITIADSGCGMTAEVRAKMFDLFFTTKGERGTGLGLATVHEIVTAAHGHIEVESEPGWGTQIRIYWPPMAEPALRVRG